MRVDQILSTIPIISQSADLKEMFYFIIVVFSDKKY